MCKLDWKNNDLNAAFIIVFVAALKNSWERLQNGRILSFHLCQIPPALICCGQLKVDGTQSENDNLQ